MTLPLLPLYGHYPLSSARNNVCSRRRRTMPSRNRTARFSSLIPFHTAPLPHDDHQNHNRHSCMTVQTVSHSSHYPLGITIEIR